MQAWSSAKNCRYKARESNAQVVREPSRNVVSAISRVAPVHLNSGDCNREARRQHVQRPRRDGGRATPASLLPSSHRAVMLHWPPRLQPWIETAERMDGSMDSQQAKQLKIVVIVLAVFLVVNLGVTGYLVGAQLGSAAGDQTASGQAVEQAEQVKYTLYIGTNDKDTYQQEISYDECVEKVTEICMRHTGGCTLAQATGYWADDTGAITSEQSIQCILEDVTLEQVHRIADEVLKALNQNSILIETQGVTSEFYAGQGE